MGGDERSGRGGGRRRRSWVGVGAAALFAAASGMALGADRGHDSGHEPRPYLAPLVGASFATLTTDSIPSATDSLFSAGAAVGIDFESCTAGWRVEFEGRYRDPVSRTQGIEGFDLTTSADHGWSTLLNVWRDVEVGEGFEVYLGGGIGAGGYSMTYDGEIPVENVTLSGGDGITSFAWQAGGGVTYAFTRRIVLDLGYRFFEVAGGGTRVTVAQSGVPIESGNLGSAFSASEVVLALRIYEPFAGW
jgi:opacity protein-like surface antigen